MLSNPNFEQFLQSLRMLLALLLFASVWVGIGVYYDSIRRKRKIKEWKAIAEEARLAAERRERDEGMEIELDD